MVPTVPENKAMVIYGRRTRTGGPGYQVLAKGGRSPMPIIEKVEMMDIGPQKIELDHRDVKILDGVVDMKASLRATATVRVLDDEEGLKVAAKHLLHVSSSDVGRMARNFTEAHLRTTLRSMDIRDATLDLGRTALTVQGKIQRDMHNIGVTVENLTIHELKLRGV
jgi:uncharacterized membrane protein YqiK